MSSQPSVPYFSPLVLGLGLVLLGVTIAAFVGGPPLVLIFLAACSLCLTITLVWNSLAKMEAGQTLEFEDALDLAAPTATEEQKLAVLRALKDLDYELTVGKISKEDFEISSAEYRAQARLLIAAQDESMKTQIKSAELRVHQHLRALDTPDAPPVARELTAPESAAQEPTTSEAP